MASADRDSPAPLRSMNRGRTPVHAEQAHAPRELPPVWPIFRHFYSSKWAKQEGATELHEWRERDRIPRSRAPLTKKRAAGRNSRRRVLAAAMLANY